MERFFLSNKDAYFVQDSWNLTELRDYFKKGEIIKEE